MADNNLPASAGPDVTTSAESVTFFNSDVYRALAIRKVLTAAEITAITNLWGTS